MKLLRMIRKGKENIETRLLGFDTLEDIGVQCRGRYRGEVSCENLSFLSDKCSYYKDGACAYRSFLDDYDG